MGLHPCSLENIRGGNKENNRNQHDTNIMACYSTSALKTQEKLLGRGWPIQPISTIFNPLVKSLTIFQHMAWQPFVVLRSITNPTDKVVIPLSPWSGVNNSFNFVFRQSIVSHNGAWLRIFPTRKKLGVVSMEWFQLRGIIWVFIIVIKFVKR